MESRQIPVYVIIGTRAQFIKIAPLLWEMVNQGMHYQLLFTAQHKENINDILGTYKLRPPDVILYTAEEASTQARFAKWFSVIIYKTLFQAKKFLPVPGIVLTHGDTFTAWIAALMGKLSGCKVAHIESGLRSFNIFSPFPEELSRLITFSLSDIYFCSSDWAVKNLKKFRGLKVNLGANTLLDGVRYASSVEENLAYDFLDQPFALVAVHRYENIYSKRFTEFIIPTLLEISEKTNLVFVLHPSTRERLKNLGLDIVLQENENISLIERFGFVEWIQLCKRAEFVITDGGSNQEELSYLGTPTLLFRNETERQEGLGENVVLSKFDREIIFDFIQNFDQYRKVQKHTDISPSKRIIQVIQEKKLKTASW